MMKETKVELESLNSPQQALQRYLDDLLMEATYPEDTSVVVEQPAIDQVETAPEPIAPTAETPLETELSEDERLDLSFADFESAIQDLQNDHSELAPVTLSKSVEAKTSSPSETLTMEGDKVLDTLNLSDMVLDEQDLSTELGDTSSDFVSDAVVTTEKLEEREDEIDEHAYGLDFSDIEEVNADSPSAVFDQAVDMVTEVQEVPIQAASHSATELDNTPSVSEISLAEEVGYPEADEVATPQAKIAKTDPLPWAKSRFECLLFYVGGLKMAVPLVELGGIYQSNKDKVTNIFGQPSWFMGVSNVGEFNLRTVDTARWVMPDHYEGELKENFKFVIQLDRSDWGLACEKVAEAISLEPAQVKWRTDRSRRPWLAGTVIDHMCAILDIQGFIELLEDPNNGYKLHVKG